ncbi:MAG: HNH endonuclease [Planctomycetaceae bacterium]|nr:HNH endonuclease [Planctomycetaceae bacterium]
MPSKPATICPRCQGIRRDGVCLKCGAKRGAEYDRSRANAQQRGYNSVWQRKSKVYLREHPLCAECQRRGRVTVATCVDHIVPHRGDRRLFWDEANWQGLCAPCHSIKTRAGR